MLTVKLAVFRVPVASITHERVTATLAGVIVQVASVVENPLPVMATIDPLSPAEGLRVMLGPLTVKLAWATSPVLPCTLIV